DSLYARSSIAETLSLRLIAEAEPTKVAHWDQELIDAILETSPGILEQLKQAADRVQAIAGCTMGPVGDRLDDGLRSIVIEPLQVRVFQPNEVLAAAGLPVPGMIIVGVGSVELDEDNGNGDRLGPGDFLFATEVLGGEAAPATARAGARGAIVLFGARGLAHELLVSCPPLLEIFAGM
ncbi:MAG TPA: cyclic nucleotide-binding domain-containing protein, partial [Polyangiaceae bacterium]|nr:cyclic nucleotide-binding domain-containing protein [Polyangiaceae bacterium]